MAAAEFDSPLSDAIERVRADRHITRVARELAAFMKQGKMLEDLAILVTPERDAVRVQPRDLTTLPRPDRGYVAVAATTIDGTILAHGALLIDPVDWSKAN